MALGKVQALGTGGCVASRRGPSNVPVRGRERAAASFGSPVERGAAPAITNPPEAGHLWALGLGRILILSFQYLRIVPSVRWLRSGRSRSLSSSVKSSRYALWGETVVPETGGFSPLCALLGSSREPLTVWASLVVTVLCARLSADSGVPLSAAHRSGIGTVHMVVRLPRLQRACPSAALDERVVDTKILWLLAPVLSSTTRVWSRPDDTDRLVMQRRESQYWMEVDHLADYQHGWGLDLDPPGSDVREGGDGDPFVLCGAAFYEGGRFGWGPAGGDELLGDASSLRNTHQDDQGVDVGIFLPAAGGSGGPLTGDDRKR